MSIILQFFYDLFQWQYFGFLVILWIVIDLVWIGKWRALMGRIGKLIVKPWIFTKDREPNDPPLYPRLFLEQLTQITRREFGNDSDPKSRSGDTFQRWINAQNERVFDVYNPLRSVGYVLALIALIFFLLANTIIIVNTMVLLGLIADLPVVLQRLDLAILGGTILSAIVGVWILIEMSGNGTLTNTDILSEAQKRIFKSFSAITVLCSVVVMIALAFQRLVSLGYLQSTPDMELILSFALYGFLAINSSLSAALVFQPAVSGLLVVIYLLILIANGFIPLFVFLVDVLWRMAYVVVDLVFWVLFTPILAIPYGLGRIFGLIR